MEDTRPSKRRPRSRAWSLIALPPFVMGILVGAAGASPDGGAFPGTGGPGGDFDWHVLAGQTVVLDTTVSTIFGGPGGQPTTQETVVNGVVDVRDLLVEAGGVLRIVGPNPCTILATGTVTIEGEVSVDGTDSPGVRTLNTTNVPEPGAPGQGGGGRGGTGSYLTSQSTPRGGQGFGAFGVLRKGGQGGETSYHPAVKDDRRGAGGGGGRFGPDVERLESGRRIRAQALVGLDAEPGFGGGPNGLGAESQSERAQGGAIGPSPFRDRDRRNDFFGLMRVPNGHVAGELPHVWAGAGGGAGGDAVRSATFPLVPFTPTGDEKGAGGGGGGGGLHVIALLGIHVRDTGEVHADGGHGGGGENTNFFDRVGGGSGGGSGGHIVFESNAIQIDGLAQNAGDDYDDAENLVHFARPVRALGGQGGAGHDNDGGADENGPSLWRCDAIPLAYFENTGSAPSTNTCFQALPDLADPLGPVVGAGGDGSPGLVQLHVPNPATDLVFTGITDGDLTKVFAPPPVGWRQGGFYGALVPLFCPDPDLAVAGGGAPDLKSARSASSPFEVGRGALPGFRLP